MRFTKDELIGQYQGQIASDRAILAAKDAEIAALRAVVEAAKELVGSKMSTFKARNGRDVGIQADDGEKCWIVHSDEMFELESALEARAALEMSGGVK